MESVYQACFYGGLVLAILFLIAAIVMFIVFKIPKVFGELTGRNAKKSMKIMNEQRGQTKDVESKKERAKYYNEHTGKIKVRDAEAQRRENTDSLRKNASLKNRDVENTEVLLEGENSASKSVLFRRNVSRDEEATDILRHETDAEEATDVLRAAAGDEDATDVLRGVSSDEDVTDVLRGVSSDEDVTDVLRGISSDEDVTDVLRGVSSDEDVTDVLRGISSDEDVTDVLRGISSDEDVTDVLRGTGIDEDATDVLRADDDSTTVLTAKARGNSSSDVTVIYNIIEIHTDEML